VPAFRICAVPDHSPLALGAVRKAATTQPLLGGGRVDDGDGEVDVVDGEIDVVAVGSEDVVVELGGRVDVVDVDVLPVVVDASVA
jgi:hypothetical protein